MNEIREVISEKLNEIEQREKKARSGDRVFFWGMTAILYP